MSFSFRVRRFLLVFAVAFVFIASVQLLKGRTFDYAATHALIWSAISASIFTAAEVYKSRRAQACAVCAPETLDADRDPAA